MAIASRLLIRGGRPGAGRAAPLLPENSVLLARQRLLTMLVELASGWNPWLPPIPEAVGELFKVLVAVVKTQVVPRAALTAENLAPGATTDFA